MMVKDGESVYSCTSQLSRRAKVLASRRPLIFTLSKYPYLCYYQLKLAYGSNPLGYLTTFPSYLI